MAHFTFLLGLVFLVCYFVYPEEGIFPIAAAMALGLATWAYVDSYLEKRKSSRAREAFGNLDVLEPWLVEEGFEVEGLFEG